MRIDSNTIQVPFSAVNYIDYNSQYLTHNESIKNGNIIKDIHSVSSSDLPIGLGHLSIDNKRQVVNISGSAKLLSDNYLDGIHKNTFAQYIDSINQLGIIELDPYKVFEQGIYHKIDTTNNVDMGMLYDLHTQWSDILGYLTIAKMNTRFDIDEYDRKDNQGITYIGKQDERNRLIMYRKYLDLSRSKDKKGISNKQFFATIKNPIKFLESTKNIIRVEQNITSFKSIRERLKIESNSIQSVLENGINPNPYMLDKITQPHRENQLLMVFNDYNPEDHSIQDVIQLEGIKNIIRSANYDESTLKKFVKRYTTESMFRWWWYGGKKSIIPFRPLIDELKKKDSNKDPQVNQVIEYIRQSMLNDKVA
jgi:hypothetical protein